MFNDLQKRGVIDNRLTFEKYREGRDQKSIKVGRKSAKKVEKKNEQLKKQNSWKNVKKSEFTLMDKQEEVKEK